MARLKIIKHEIFAQAVADGMQPEDAYGFAGYKASRAHALRLYHRPEVHKRVAELIKKNMYKSGADVSVNRVMLELQRIAFSDIRNVVKWVTREELIPLGKPGIPGKPQPISTRRVIDFITVDSDKLDDDTAAAIQEVTRGKDGSIKVKFYDKRAALIDIGKQLGMFTERVEIGGPGDFARLNDDELERFIRAKVVNLSPESEEAPSDEDEEQVEDEHSANDDSEDQLSLPSPEVISDASDEDE